MNDCTCTPDRCLEEGCAYACRDGRYLLGCPALEAELERIAQVRAAIAQPGIPTRSPSLRLPTDTALRRLDEVLRALVADPDVDATMILGRVANALTGEINGLRQRAMARAMVEAADREAAIPEAVHRAAWVEARRREDLEETSR